jgi:uncharacterized protein YndB with AHSA1/START domain
MALGNSNDLVIRRRLPVPRNELYAAWTDPRTMGLWMCPGNIASADVTMDLRVGGSLLIVMRDEEKSYEHRGTFKIVDPPERLAFTWIAQATEMQETLVTVEFIELSDSESELVLTHENFPRADLRDRHQGGWGQIGSRLEQYLRLRQ